MAWFFQSLHGAPLLHTLQHLLPFRIACHLNAALRALLQHAGLNLRCSAFVNLPLPMLS